jgi:alkanesulfonate monooxygenase SsuD/methylene tetrahydromethanopterin reductase-like flavin-dependent oxidoreductase (luciferase family)
MDFGQFNLMGYRERGTPTMRLLDEAVLQAKAAEAAGFAIAWFAEHHFSNYCVCPSPLLMVARLAGETRRIRLGTAVVVVPLYYPARLLAEIGMADSLCGGRLVLGVGSGYRPYEFERFGVDLAESKAMLEEFMDMCELAFTRDTFSYAGKHYRLAETHISARPVRGLPEVWLPGDDPGIHRICARRGYVPLFTGRLFGPDYLERMRATIGESFQAEGRDPATMPLAVQRFMCVTRSRRETLDYVDHARHQMRLASNLRRRAQVFDGSMLVEQPIPNELPIEQIADNLLVGDVETIAARLTEEIRRARPSHMMFHVQVGGSDFRQAMETIERFATDIRPAVERVLGPLATLPTVADPAAAAHAI